MAVVQNNSEIFGRIARIDPVGAETIRKNPTTFTRQSLPFYRKFTLLRADIRLPHRPVQFRYADDGAHLVALDGTPGSLERVNREDGLRLSPGDLAAYLRFFCENTGEGKLRPVERPDEVTWVSAVGRDPSLRQIKERVEARIHPLRSRQRADGRFEASLTALRDRTLVEAIFVVAPDGRVEPGQETMLVENAPIPYVW